MKCLPYCLVVLQYKANRIQESLKLWNSKAFKKVPRCQFHSETDRFNEYIIGNVVRHRWDSWFVSTEVSGFFLFFSFLNSAWMDVQELRFPQDPVSVESSSNPHGEDVGEYLVERWSVSTRLNESEWVTIWNAEDSDSVWNSTAMWKLGRSLRPCSDTLNVCLNYGEICQKH